MSTLSKHGVRSKSRFRKLLDEYHELEVAEYFDAPPVNPDDETIRILRDMAECEAELLYPDEDDDDYDDYEEWYDEDEDWDDDDYEMSIFWYGYDDSLDDVYGTIVDQPGRSDVGTYFKQGNRTYLCCEIHGCFVLVDVHTGKEAKPSVMGLERVG